MDDMFGMLYGDLDPKKKLLSIVTCNMVGSLVTLLEEHPELDLNSPLQQANGNTALHVSCWSGHHGCVKHILTVGGSVDVENDFGFLPLQLALRQGHIDCVKLIMETGSPRTDPSLIWQSLQRDDIPTWLGYDEGILRYLLIATADFNKMADQIKFQFYLHKVSDMDCLPLVRTFFQTGCRLLSPELGQLLANADKAGKAAIKECTAVQHLQHYARLAIRRALQPNVPFGANILPLPPKLREYLLYAEDP